MTDTTNKKDGGAGKSMNVLVVDDHTLIAETFAVALSSFGAFDVACASDLEAAELRIRDIGRFDVILLDYEMPGIQSLEGLSRMIQANSGGVALFSGVANWSVVDRAIEMGASGFVPKTLPLEAVAHALRFISAGQTFVPTDVLRRIKTEDQNAVDLKPRELKVLGFLNEGLPNKEIGRELDVEEWVIKMDVKSICRKLGVRNRTLAVLTARRLGWV